MLRKFSDKGRNDRHFERRQDRDSQKANNARIRKVKLERNRDYSSYRRTSDEIDQENREANAAAWRKSCQSRSNSRLEHSRERSSDRSSSISRNFEDSPCSCSTRISQQSPFQRDPERSFRSRRDRSASSSDESFRSRRRRHRRTPQKEVRLERILPFGKFEPQDKYQGWLIVN